MLRLASAHAQRRAARTAQSSGLQAATTTTAAGTAAIAAAIAAAASSAVSSCAWRSLSSHSRSVRRVDPPRRSPHHDDDDEHNSRRLRWNRPRSGVGAAVDDGCKQMRRAGAAAATGATQRTRHDDDDDDPSSSRLPPPSLQSALDAALLAVAAEDAAMGSRRRLRSDECPTFAAHLRLLSAAIDGFAEAQPTPTATLSADAARASRRDFFSWVQASAGRLWPTGAAALAPATRASDVNAQALLRYYLAWLQFSVDSMDSPRMKWTLIQIEHWDRVRSQQMRPQRARAHVSWLYHPHTLALLLRFYQSLILEVRDKAKDADATISQTHLHKLMITLPADALRLLPASPAPKPAAAAQSASTDSPSPVAPEDAWLYPDASRSSVTSALPHLHARVTELCVLSELWEQAANASATTQTEEELDSFAELQQSLLQTLQMSLEPGQPPSEALQSLAARLRSSPTVYRHSADDDGLLDTSSIDGDSVTASFEVLIKQHSLVRPVPDLAALAELLSSMRRQCRPTASVYNSLLNAALVVARHTIKLQSLAPREVQRLKLKSALECFEFMQRLLAEMRALQPNGKPTVQPNSSTYVVLVNAHSLASLGDVRAGSGQAAQHLPALLALYEDMLHTLAAPHIRLLNHFLQSFARLEDPQRPDLSLQIYQAMLTHGEIDASGTRQLRGLDEAGRVRWTGVVPNSITFDLMLGVFARAGMVKQAVSCYALMIKLAARPPPDVPGEESPKPTSASIQATMQLLMRESDADLHRSHLPMVDSMFADLARFGLHKNLMHFTYTLRARIEMQNWTGVEALIHELTSSTAPQTMMALRLAREPPVVNRSRSLNVQFRHQAMEALIRADRVSAVTSAHKWLLPDSSEPVYRDFERSGPQQVGGGFWRWTFYDYLGFLELAPSLPMFRAILSLMPRADASCHPAPVGSLRLTANQWSAVVTRLLHKNPLCSSFGSWKRYARSTGRTDFRMDWPVFLSANAEHVAAIRADPVAAQLLARFPFELLCAEVRIEWLRLGFFGAQAESTGHVLQLGVDRSTHAHLHCEMELFKRAGRISEWAASHGYSDAVMPELEAAKEAHVSERQQSESSGTSVVVSQPAASDAAATPSPVDAESALDQQRLLQWRAEAEASARARASAQDARKKKRETEAQKKKQTVRPSIEPGAAPAPQALSLSAAVEQAKLQSPPVVAIESPPPSPPLPRVVSRPVERRDPVQRAPPVAARAAAAAAAVEDEPIEPVALPRKQLLRPVASPPTMPEPNKTKEKPTPQEKLAARMDRTLALAGVPEAFRAPQLASYLRPLMLDGDSQSVSHPLRIHRNQRSQGGAIVQFPSASIARRVEQRLEAIAVGAPADLPPLLHAMQRHPARIRSTPCTADHVAQLQDYSVVLSDKLDGEAAHFTAAPVPEGATPGPLVALHGFPQQATLNEIGPFLKLALPADAPAVEISSRLDAVLVRFPSTEMAQAMLERITQLTESQPDLFTPRISGRFLSTSTASFVSWPLLYPNHVLSLFGLSAALPTSQLLEFVAEHGLLQVPTGAIHTRYVRPTPTQSGCWQVHFGSEAWLDSAWATLFLADSLATPHTWSWRGRDVQAKISHINSNKPGGNNGWLSIEPEQIEAVSPVHRIPLQTPLCSTLLLQGFPPAQFTSATAVCNYLNAHGYFPAHAEITLGVQVSRAVATYAQQLKQWSGDPRNRPQPPTKPQDIILFCGSKRFAACVLHSMAQRRRTQDPAAAIAGKAISCRFLTRWPADRTPVSGLKSWSNRATELAIHNPVMRKLNSRIVTFHGFAAADRAAVREYLSSLIPGHGELGMQEWRWGRVIVDVGSPAVVESLLSRAEKEPAAFAFKGRPLRLSRFYLPAQLPPAADSFVRWNLPPLHSHAIGQTPAETAVAAEDEDEDDEEAFAPVSAAPPQSPPREAEPEPIVEFIPARAQVLPQPPPLPLHSRIVSKAASTLAHPTLAVTMEPTPVAERTLAGTEPEPHMRAEAAAAEAEAAPPARKQTIDLTSAELDHPPASRLTEEDGPTAAAVEPAELGVRQPATPAPADPMVQPAAAPNRPSLSFATMDAKAIVPGPAVDQPLPRAAHSATPAEDRPAVVISTSPVRPALTQGVKTVQPRVESKPALPALPLLPSFVPVSSPLAFARPLVIPPVFASSFRVGIRFPAVLPQHASVFSSRFPSAPAPFSPLLSRARTVAEVISLFQARFESRGLMTPFKAATRVMLANERTELLLFPPLALLTLRPEAAARRRNQSLRIGLHFDRALRDSRATVVQELNAAVTRMVKVAARSPMPDIAAATPRSAVDSAAAAAAASAPFGVRDFFFTYAPLLIHFECHASLEALFLHFARDRQLYPALLCMHHLMHSQAHDALTAEPATAPADDAAATAEPLVKAGKFVGLNPACYDRLTKMMRWSIAQLRGKRDDEDSGLKEQTAAAPAAAAPSPFAPMQSLLLHLLSQYSSSFDSVQCSYWGRQYCRLESASRSLWLRDPSDDGAEERRALLPAWQETTERAKAFMSQYRSSLLGADMDKPTAAAAMPLFPLSVYAGWRVGARAQLDWLSRASPMQIQSATAAYLDLLTPATSPSPSDPAAVAAASMLLDATSAPGVALLTLLGRLSSQLWRLQAQQTGDESLDASLLPQAEAIFRDITLHAIDPSELQDGNLAAQPIVLLACTRWALEHMRRWDALSTASPLSRLVVSKLLNVCKLLERVPSIAPTAALHQRLFRVHDPISVLATMEPSVNDDDRPSSLLMHALEKLKEVVRTLDPDSAQSRDGAPPLRPGERPVELPALAHSEAARRALIDSHVVVLLELALTLRSRETRDRSAPASSGSSLQSFVRAQIAELIDHWANMPSMRSHGRTHSGEASPVEYMLHAMWKLHSSEQMQQRYAQSTRARSIVDPAAAAPLPVSDSAAVASASPFSLLSPVVLSPLLAVAESCVPLSVSGLRALALLAQHKDESALRHMERVVRVIERSIQHTHTTHMQAHDTHDKPRINGEASAKGASSESARLSDVSALYHSVLRFYASIHALGHVVALLELMRQRGVPLLMQTFHSLLIAFNGSMDAHRNRSMGGRFGGANGRGIGSAGAGAYDAQVQALYAAMREHIRAHIKPAGQTIESLQLQRPQQSSIDPAQRPNAETLTLLLHAALHSASLTFAQTVWSQLTGLSRSHADDPLDSAAVAAAALWAPSSASASGSRPSLSLSLSLSPVLVVPSLSDCVLMLFVFEKHGQLGPAVDWLHDIGFTRTHAHTHGHSTHVSPHSSAAASSPSCPPSAALLSVLGSPVFVLSVLSLLSALAPPLDARRARTAHQRWAAHRDSNQHNKHTMQQANETAERAAVDIARDLSAQQQRTQQRSSDVTAHEPAQTDAAGAQAQAQHTSDATAGWEDQ